MDQKTQPTKNTVANRSLTKVANKKKRQQPRDKIRQLLRSMLQMDDEPRELKEEQTLFQ